MGTGLFSYEWNGVTYASPDTAGAALAALAKYYDTNADAKTVVDTILKALPGAMNEAGSFGSANSDAMVFMGLLAMGKDPSLLTTLPVSMLWTVCCLMSIPTPISPVRRYR